jgi:hypothetical protein
MSFLGYHLEANYFYTDRLSLVAVRSFRNPRILETGPGPVFSKLGKKPDQTGL